MARAIEKLQEPGKLSLAGFKCVEGVCRPSEAAIVTLYNLGSYKDELRSMHKDYLEERGIDGNIAKIYDINDILSALEDWQSEAKGRYQNLFKIFNRILETTS